MVRRMMASVCRAIRRSRWADLRGATRGTERRNHQARDERRGKKRAGDGAKASSVFPAHYSKVRCAATGVKRGMSEWDIRYRILDIRRRLGVATEIVASGRVQVWLRWRSASQGGSYKRRANLKIRGLCGEGAQQCCAPTRRNLVRGGVGVRGDFAGEGAVDVDEITGGENHADYPPDEADFQAIGASFGVGDC